MMTGLQKLLSIHRSPSFCPIDRRVVPLFQEEDQQQRVLVGLVSGEPVSCPAFTLHTK